jgi:putative endonuclease
MGSGGVASTRQVGDVGERIAEAFLVLKGYEILRRNFRYAGREIDLVARKGSRLIAVEVRLRRSARFGCAVESIDQRKLARLRVALEGALRERGLPLKPQIDVVLIDLEDRLMRMVVTHIEAVS